MDNNNEFLDKPKNNSLKVKINEFEEVLSEKLLNKDFEANNKFSLLGKFQGKQLIKLNHHFTAKDQILDVKNEAILQMNCNNTGKSYRLKIKPNSINHHLDLGFFKKNIFNFNYWFNPYLAVNHNNQLDDLNFQFGKILTFKNYVSHYAFNFSLNEKCPIIVHNSLINYKNLLLNYTYSFDCKNSFLPLKRSFQLNYKFNDQVELTLQGHNKKPEKAFDFNFNNIVSRLSLNKKELGKAAVELKFAESNSYALAFEKDIKDHTVKTRVTKESIDLFAKYKFCCGQLLFSMSRNLNDSENNFGMKVDYFD